MLLSNLSYTRVCWESGPWKMDRGRYVQEGRKSIWPVAPTVLNEFTFFRTTLPFCSYRLALLLPTEN